MKSRKLTIRLLSVLAAAVFSLSLPVTSFALFESTTAEQLNPGDIEPEDTEPEIEPEEPEETGDMDDPDDPDEGDTPSVSLDEDPIITPAETTAAQTTAAETPAPAGTTPLPTYIPENEHTMYVPQVINIRRGPSTDFDKLGVLYVGSEVTVIGNNGEWSAISYNGGIGYVLTSLLSAEPPAAAATTQPPAPETTPETAEQTPPPDQAEVLPPADAETGILTTAAESEPETKAPEKTTAKTTSSEQTKAPAAASSTGTGGGLPPIIPALLSAAAAFLLIGALPVFIHKVHHKNLYRY